MPPDFGDSDRDFEDDFADSNVAIVVSLAKNICSGDWHFCFGEEASPKEHDNYGDYEIAERRPHKKFAHRTIGRLFR